MHLMVFVEVVERENFTRAAEALHMTQPAVSQYIAALETEFGVKLLERTNKSVQMNKAGKVVYQSAKEILRHYKQMEIRVADLKNEPSGELIIGASYTIGEYVLPAILVRLQTMYPHILPEVIIGNTEEIGKKLLRHEIDIGLIEGEYRHQGLVTEPFAIDALYIIASSRLSLHDKGEMSVTELAEQTWLIREQGSGTRVMTTGFLLEQGIMPKRMLTFGSTQVIKEAIEAGIGIALLSEATIKKELQLGIVQKVHVAGIPVERTFAMIKQKQAFYPKALSVFEEIVRKG